MTTNPPSSADAEPTLHGRALMASLTVNDLEKSLAWYRDALGFALDQRHEREGTLLAVSMRAGDVRILLNRDDGARGWDRAKGQGLSLMITTTGDVDAVAERVRAYGTTLDSEPADTPWGDRAFRVRDPDGFRFVISSRG